MKSENYSRCPELEFAKQRWPSAGGRVFPVIVDPAISTADLPVYLRSVHALVAQGNVTAEVATAVHKTRKVGLLCKSVTALAFAAVMGAGIGFAMEQPPVEVAMLPMQKIQFRSTMQPPRRDATADTPKWVDSPLTITVMPLAYQHRTEPGRRARILSETITLDYGGTIVPYRASYVVEITDAASGERRYCNQGNAEPVTLDPGKTISREMMFVSRASYTPSWKEFANSILGHEGFRIRLEVASEIEVPGNAGVVRNKLVMRCTIDVAAVRAGMQRAGYTMTDPSKPDYLQADCKT